MRYSPEDPRRIRGDQKCTGDGAAACIHVLDGGVVKLCLYKRRRDTADTRNDRPPRRLFHDRHTARLYHCGHAAAFEEEQPGCVSGALLFRETPNGFHFREIFFQVDERNAMAISCERYVTFPRLQLVIFLAYVSRALSSMRLLCRRCSPVRTDRPEVAALRTTRSRVQPRAEVGRASVRSRSNLLHCRACHVNPHIFDVPLIRVRHSLDT